MQKLLNITLCFLFVQSALAAGNKDTVKVSGYGVGVEKSCAAFVRETNEKDANKARMYGDETLHPERRLYLEWLSGFLTAHSWITEKNVTGGRNSNDLLSWIRNYCEKHPFDSFLIAAEELLAELKKRK